MNAEAVRILKEIMDLSSSEIIDTEVYDNLRSMNNAKMLSNSTSLQAYFSDNNNFNNLCNIMKNVINDKLTSLSPNMQTLVGSKLTKDESNAYFEILLYCLWGKSRKNKKSISNSYAEPFMNAWRKMNFQEDGIRLPEAITDSLAFDEVYSSIKTKKAAANGFDSIILGVSGTEKNTRLFLRLIEQKMNSSDFYRLPKYSNKLKTSVPEIEISKHLHKNIVEKFQNKLLNHNISSEFSAKFSALLYSRARHCAPNEGLSLLTKVKTSQPNLYSIATNYSNVEQFNQLLFILIKQAQIQSLIKSQKTFPMNLDGKTNLYTISKNSIVDEIEVNTLKINGNWFKVDIEKDGDSTKIRIPQLSGENQLYTQINHEIKIAVNEEMKKNKSFDLCINNDKTELELMREINQLQQIVCRQIVKKLNFDPKYAIKTVIEVCGSQKGVRQILGYIEHFKKYRGLVDYDGIQEWTLPFGTITDNIFSGSYLVEEVKEKVFKEALYNYFLRKRTPNAQHLNYEDIEDIVTEAPDITKYLNKQMNDQHKLSSRFITHSNPVKSLVLYDYENFNEMIKKGDDEKMALKATKYLEIIFNFNELAERINDIPNSKLFNNPFAFALKHRGFYNTLKFCLIFGSRTNGTYSYEYFKMWADYLEKVYLGKNTEVCSEILDIIRNHDNNSSIDLLSRQNSNLRLPLIGLIAQAYTDIWEVAINHVFQLVRTNDFSFLHLKGVKGKKIDIRKTSSRLYNLEIDGKLKSNKLSICFLGGENRKVKINQKYSKRIGTNWKTNRILPPNLHPFFSDFVNELKNINELIKI